MDFERGLNNSRQWLSAATKAKAIEKLEAMTFYFGWPGDDSGRKNWLVKVPKERKSLYQDILDLFCQRSALIDQMKGKEGEADLFYAQEWSDQSYRPNARYMHLNNSIDIMSINLVEPIFDLPSGISGDELDRQGREFFRGFAYGWMENMSADEIENYKKDEHAANCLRVNGNVYLMDEFYRLFNCQDGKMYLAPKDRIEIW